VLEMLPCEPARRWRVRANISALPAVRLRPSKNILTSTDGSPMIWLDAKKHRGSPMEAFLELYSGMIVFVYHCFDRVVINGYLSLLSRPENVVYFFRQVVGIQAITKEVLSKRTREYQRWVEAYARNRGIPMQWAEKGVRKEDFVAPYLRRMQRQNRYGVYCILQSMEQGWT
jgi:hypothetical protein